MTPVLRLSGTILAGTPAKNSRANTCASTHDAWSMTSTGRKNISREYTNTMMNPWTRRASSPAGGVSRSTRTAARAVSSSTFAQMKRRNDDSDAARP